MAKKPRLEWTPEIDAELLRLRHIEKFRWGTIAARIGRSRTSTHAHYLAISAPEGRVKTYPRTWTKELEAELLHMRVVGCKPIAEIAGLVGRTLQSVASKLERLQNGPRARVHSEITHKKVIPPQVLMDRDRRATAYRDITSTLCGDPGPGQSALDRR